MIIKAHISSIEIENETQYLIRVDYSMGFDVESHSVMHDTNIENVSKYYEAFVTDIHNIIDMYIKNQAIIKVKILGS